MNNKLIDCIKRGKEKEAEEARLWRANREQQKKERLEMIQEIEEYFKKLPDGRYIIDLEQEYISGKVVYKNTDFKIFNRFLIIERSKHLRLIPQVFIINKSNLSPFESCISSSLDIWSFEKVKALYDNLDWVLEEIGKQYGCLGGAKAADD